MSSDAEMCSFIKVESNAQDQDQVKLSESESWAEDTSELLITSINYSHTNMYISLKITDSVSLEICSSISSYRFLWWRGALDCGDISLHVYFSPPHGCWDTLSVAGSLKLGSAAPITLCSSSSRLRSLQSRSGRFWLSGCCQSGEFFLNYAMKMIPGPTSKQIQNLNTTKWH